MISAAMRNSMNSNHVVQTDPRDLAVNGLLMEVARAGFGDDENFIARVMSALANTQPDRRQNARSSGDGGSWPSRHQ